MAPLRNLPDSSLQAPKSILKKSSATSLSSQRPEPLFATSKKDKRKIKHAQLISKVTKSATKPRRRRPNKKLVATLDSLAEALPDDDETTARPDDQVNIIKRKSMKSKPGALKRRERLDKSERDRFAKNMAQLAGSNANAEQGTSNGGSSATPSAGLSKWAALRGFISQTLEQRPDVKIALG